MKYKDCKLKKAVVCHNLAKLNSEMIAGPVLDAKASILLQRTNYSLPQYLVWLV
jgi:hypothetical protein